MLAVPPPGGLCDVAPKRLVAQAKQRRAKVVSCVKLRFFLYEFNDFGSMFVVSASCVFLARFFLIRFNAF